MDTIKSDLPEEVLNSIEQYKGAGIQISLSLVFDKKVSVLISQVRKNSDTVLTGRKLNQIAESVIEPLIVKGYNYSIQTKTWHGNELECISSNWVKQNMEIYRITQRELCEKIGVDKFVLSKLLNNTFAFTRWHKSTFYYFFLSIKLENKIQGDKALIENSNNSEIEFMNNSSYRNGESTPSKPSIKAVQKYKF